MSDAQADQPGRAIVRIEAGSVPALGDVVDVLRAKAVALERLAATIERLRADGWRTDGAVGLAFSLGVDGVHVERDVAGFGELERLAGALPAGTVLHWHRHDRSWRSGGWIAGLPPAEQLGETDELPVIVQSTRSGRQTRCEDQQQLVAAIRLHLEEIRDALDSDALTRARADEVRAQLRALDAGEAPQVFYRFEGSPEAEDALNSAHMVHVTPEALALWEGFQDGVAGEPLYEGDTRLEGLTGLAFRDGFRRGEERAHLLGR
ncbi:hypothetical protein VSS74_17680 [Conexibacter stalactiti]|uniref:DUF222 domain-containing protein n=1 Tax=Conexibacter stalactiti TaxID=1940611 RepID=A0ABU4HS95_9ACTN|nr:hypothetical protein [Conexibacter stalactiti]MDW5596183.1 hypothetical protein [Conexibacter stalactiti]MEC5036825.1 hypothetical protein [Conexibacter stalactiti]